MVLYPARTLATNDTVAWIDTLVGFSVTRLVAAAVVVRFTLDFVASDVGVSWVTSMFGRTRAEGFVTNGFALGFLRAEGVFARVLAHFSPAQWIRSTGQVVLATSVVGTFVGTSAAFGHVTDFSRWTFASERSRQVLALHSSGTD